MNKYVPRIFEKKDLRNFYGIAKNSTMLKRVFSDEIFDQIGITEAEYKSVIRYFDLETCDKMRAVLGLPLPQPRQTPPNLDQPEPTLTR